MADVQVQGTGFPFDIILPSQVRDRIARVDGMITSLMSNVIETSNGPKGKAFTACLDVGGLSGWYERWKAYKDGLGFWDININTVGTWDQLDTYEREYETWRKVVADCGSKVPPGIEKPPESKAPALLGGTGILLLGAAALLLASKARR